jgi:hypothetical protein
MFLYDSAGFSPHAVFIGTMVAPFRLASRRPANREQLLS